MALRAFCTCRHPTPPRSRPSTPGGRGRFRSSGGVFQLGVHTLSFLRVGAFALAHAAISSALLLVADLMPERVSYWLVLILMQALAVTLETLVVFVQTTRLMFFGFFTRFLRADGRGFQPLHPPPDQDRADSK